MTDKPTEEKELKEPAPQQPDKSAVRQRSSKPKPSQTPLEQTIQAFVNAFVTDDLAVRLRTELRAVGIETIDDLGPHRLGDVNQALRAALRADAHAFYAAAAAYRGEA